MRKIFISPHYAYVMNSIHVNVGLAELQNTVIYATEKIFWPFWILSVFGDSLLDPIVLLNKILTTLEKIKW